jgi:hypothetical protein
MFTRKFLHMLVSLPSMLVSLPCAAVLIYLWEAADILSVKIAASDVCFPLEVYGTVIARDYLDCKCVYLFRRPREDCQVIHSEVAHLYF